MSQFLDLLRPIAETTLDNEPQTLAYAWFEHVEDGSGIPDHWIRGFEMYETLEASTETHRSSPEYKEMRRMVGEGNVFERPSDLRYLQPVSSSFLRREEATSVILQASRLTSVAPSLYITVEEWRPNEGDLSQLDNVVEEFVRHAHASSDSVEAFLALKYLEQYDDSSIVSIAVHSSPTSRREWSSMPITIGLRERLQSLCQWCRKTEWKSTGIGFLGRD